MNKLIAFSIIAFLFASTEIRAAEVTASPRQLLTGLTCDEVRKITASNEYNELSAEEALEVQLRLESCRVEYQNKKAKPEDRELVVVTPKKGKVFFNTIRIKDAENVKRHCDFISQNLVGTLEAMGAAIDPAAGPLLSIATNDGKVQCDAFFKALQTDNIMLVLAPDLISGTAITVNVLTMMGQGVPAKKIQETMDRIGVEGGKVIKQGFKDVKKHPILLMPGTGGEVLRAGYIAKKWAKNNPIPKKKIPKKLPSKCSRKGLKIKCT